MGKERLNDIVILRSVSILLVVFVHCFYIYNYGQLSDIDTVGLSIERVLNLDILNRFRMPMFIFISGFLFSFLHYKKHKYPRFIDLFKNKFKRLIIPYWVFFPITALCLGKLFHLSIMDFLYPMGHLWFILMLFWCFVMTKLILVTHLDKRLLYIMMIFLILYLLSYFSGSITKIVGMSDFSKNYIYFFSGFICYKYDNFLQLRTANVSKIIMIGCGALLMIWIVLLFMRSSHFSWAKLFSPASSLLIVLFGYSIVNKLLNLGFFKNKLIFEKINRLSYGIYICHPWIIDSITSNATIITIAKENTLLFPLCLFAFVLTCSIIFSELMLKTRVGRFLIG